MQLLVGKGLPWEVSNLLLSIGQVPQSPVGGRLRLKCDGTHAETRFRLSAKRMSPFKLARTSVHSTTGS